MEFLDKKVIVITTINNPSEAIVKFSGINAYELIVVGDDKTPLNWNYPKVKFLSISEQNRIGSNLYKVLPHNHYCRKMMGYLLGIYEGAQYIVDSDDDNIPKEDWKFPDFEGIYDNIPSQNGFVNIYKYYTNKKIWARGLPLNKINENNNDLTKFEKKNSKIGVWQGLADEDPDVDAIYRLTSNEPCYFNNIDPIVLGIGTISPFNSQNTIITKELFPLLYLPSYVTFRFTDILRGLIAQPIMWLYGYQLGFTNATVIQKRNLHDFYSDFISEIPMYLNSEKIFDLTLNTVKSHYSIENNLFNTYHALHLNKIVPYDELRVLEAWLNDLKIFM